MVPARGDSKPCGVVGCAGTVVFGRKSANHTPQSAPERPADQALIAADPMGWICGSDRGHFRERD